MDTQLRNGFHFPKYDRQCHRVVFDERYKIDEVLKYCPEKRGVIQAGGNVGVFPVRLAEHFEKVYTYEPDPENYHCLMMNLEEREASNIKVKWAGLGAEITTGRMNKPHRNNCGANEMVPGFGINIVTLDSQFPIVTDIDLLYLDVEGAEAKTLVGGLDLIERCKPVIVVENKGLIPEFPGDINGSTGFRDWICSFGYSHERRLQRDDVFVPVGRKANRGK